MIELMEGLPDNIVAVTCSGHVTSQDYQRVLIPAVEASLKKHEKIRLLYRVAPNFAAIAPGAMLEDANVGFSHLSRWERIAVVTDVAWIRMTILAFSFLLPGRVRVFTLSDEALARQWIVARSDADA